MVKAGKWFRNLLTGKKEKNQEKEIEKSVWLQLPPPPPPPPTTPKEKKRRSFNNQNDQFALFVPDFKQRQHSMAVASATVAAVYPAKAANRKARFAPIEEIAAIKIQSSFRSYLDMEKNVEIDIAQSKDISKNRKSNQITHNKTEERRNFSYLKASSGPSILNEISSGTRSARFEEYSSFTASKNNSQLSSAASHKPGRMSYSEEFVIQEKPYLMSHDSPLYPKYMAKTESWRAKTRSQSAPRQIPESFNQKLSNKQREFEGRNFGRGTAIKDQHPWCDELDRSTTKTDNYRSIVA